MTTAIAAIATNGAANLMRRGRIDDLQLSYVKMRVLDADAGPPGSFRTFVNAGARLQSGYEPTRTARGGAPPRPALSRCVGAVRLTRGRRGPRPGDRRARPLQTAPAARRGGARLPAQRAAQRLPHLAPHRLPP